MIKRYSKKEKREIESVFIQMRKRSSTFRDRPSVVQFVAVNGKKKVDDSETEVASEIRSKKETKVPAIAAVAERERNHK